MALSLCDETLARRFEAKVVRGDGCWGWTGAISNRTGTGRPIIQVNGRKRHATYASWLLFRGPIPDGMWLLHRCDNGICTNPDHLFLGNHRDNMDDLVAKGRQRQGVDINTAKLNPSLVREIRALRGTKSPGAIAREYGVSRWGIRLLFENKTWKGVS